MPILWKCSTRAASMAPAAWLQGCRSGGPSAGGEIQLTQQAVIQNDLPVHIGGSARRGENFANLWALEATIASEKGSVTVSKVKINSVKLRVERRFTNFVKHARDGQEAVIFKPAVAVQ
ncbi:uncharacterized protein [Physcomitrium patens]|uniref:uncharacterized protein n=1 Tax=Physcomitrium patens TaxID=3218 RepID=UPI003CCE470B